MTDLADRLSAAGNGDFTWRGNLFREAAAAIRNRRRGVCFQAEFAALLRDSDGSPQGGDGEAGSVRSTTARAGTASPNPSKEQPQ